MSVVEPAALLQGSGLFERDLDILEFAGVRFTSDQKTLLEQATVPGSGQYFCLTLLPLLDRGDRYRYNTPMVFYDEATDTESMVFYPGIVLVEWDLLLADVEQFDRYEPAWRRFPTLPGRLMGDGYMMCDGELSGYRLWNLLPVDGAMANEVAQCVEDWMCDGYMAINEFLSVCHGEVDVCEYAEYTGHGEEDGHVHLDRDGKRITATESDYAYASCQTGEEAFNAMEDELTVERRRPDDSVYAVFRAPHPLRLPPEITVEWESFVASAQRNTYQAMSSYPPWDRDEVLQSERPYSPWLWSS